MTRKIFFLAIFYICSIHEIFSQDSFSLPFGEYYLFTHRDKYYIIDTKKLYETHDGIHWTSKEHHLDFHKVELAHLNIDSTTTYLFYRSGGNTYKFDGKKFTAVYSKGEFRNQHHSFAFTYHQKPHLFGGYGLFTLKNIITYLNTDVSSWESVPYYGKEASIPKARFNPMAQQVANDLYIGLGYNVEVSPNQDDKNILLTDFWKLDLGTKLWTKLGNCNEALQKRRLIMNSDTFLSTYIIGPNNTIVMPSYTKLYFLDISQNKIHFFPNNKLPQNYIKLNHFAYNPYTDKFFYIILNLDKFYSPTIVSNRDLRGDKEIVYDLYQSEFELNGHLAGGLICFGLLVIGVWGYLRQKNKRNTQSIFQKIESQKDVILLQLNSDCRSILEIIYKNFPNSVSYTELMSIYGNKYSYDTIKKHLKDDLDEIDDKIKKILNEKESIFIIDKRDEDKRMKEVGFRI